MKAIAFCTLLLLPVLLQGQPRTGTDTIKIREVVIKSRYHTPPTAFRVELIDSLAISDYTHGSLASLLSENTSLFIKSYGQGGIATPSFRGTGPGHTTIAWNNINLNNPMPGQFDLSLVPAGFADNVRVSVGGGELDHNNGGTGGVINIETRPEWEKQNIVFVNPGSGSFGRYSGLIKAITGTGNFQSVTKLFFNQADNDFPYLNTYGSKEPVPERRRNNEVSQKGFMQELYLKRADKIFSGRIWYQAASRNLPVPLSMLHSDQGEKMDDRSFRALLSFESLKELMKLNIAAAFITDLNNYKNEVASINSVNRSETIVLKANAIPDINSDIRLRIFAENELNIINSTNYNGKKNRNRASAGFSVEADPAGWISTILMIRETVMDEKFLIPDFSAGTEIRAFPGKEYLLKANISKNSKIPTLNDMYWIPGGNPDLKNENGFTAEAGWAMAGTLSPALKLKGELTLYRSKINNMIQWHPGESAFWEAGNVNKITARGLESEITLCYSSHGFTADTRVNYTLTKASYADPSKELIGEAEKQLIYTPENQVSSSLRIYWKDFISAVRINYAGRRYLTVDNSQYLPGRTLCDANLGYKITSGHNTYKIAIAFENLFNINYQDITWYPMPGRAYSFSLIYQFKN